MELTFLLIDQIIALAIMVLVGFVVTKLGLLNDERCQILSLVLVYIINPCAIFNAFMGEFTHDKLNGFLMSLLLYFIIHLVFLALGTLLGKTGPRLTPGEQGTVIYTNAGNIIIPIIQNTLGVEYVLYISAVMTVQNLFFWTHASMLMGGKSQLSLRKIVTHPCMMAVFLGIAVFFSPFRLPVPVATAVSSLGNCVGPLCMLVTGALLAQADLKGAFSRFRTYLTICLRLVIFPAIGMVFLLMVHRVWAHPAALDILTVLVLCVASSPANTVTQLAQMYNNPESPYISALNAVCTVLCAFTLPVAVTVFRTLALAG